MKHHECQSDRLNFAKYDEAKRILYLSFKPHGKVYGYKNVPVQIFNHLTTAKTRETPIGDEFPKSEGSYAIHHITGVRGKAAPFDYWLLNDEEVKNLG